MTDAGSADEDPVEELLIRVFDRPEQEWDLAVRELCAAHPEHAAKLAQRYDKIHSASFDGPPDQRAEIPDQLGEFRLIERIGAGGMGVVFRAAQAGLERPVALKLVRPEHLYFPGARERLKREVRIISKFQHPGIVPVYAVGEADGIPYFAMEWVPGVTLGEILDELRCDDPASLSARELGRVFRSRGCEDVPEDARLEQSFGRSWAEIALRLIQQAAEALHHAHRRGVLHRDIKPSNLIVSPDGRVRILDFGLSLTQHASRMTKAGFAVGSLPYMSPEQLRDGWLDPRTDVYALGITLYEALTTRCPYLVESEETTRRKILEARPELPRQLHRGLSWDVETVCLVAMDPDPGRRYSTAERFAADIANVLAHRTIEGQRPSVALRARRWVQRHPTISVALASAALLLLLVPFALWWQNRAHTERLETTLTEIRRLSDAVIVERLLALESELWPTTGERAPALQDWIDEANLVLSRGDVHRAALARLREGALPYTEQARAADAERRRVLEERASSREELRPRIRERALERRDAADLQALDRLIAADRAGIADRYTWEFGDTYDVWQHQVLVELLGDLDRLPALLASVTRRLTFARRVDRDSLEAPAARWREVITDIARSPAYARFELRPQRGLVPLGKDPDSGFHEFAHLESGSPPPRDPTTQRLRITGETGIVFVLLPAGRFVMGARKPESTAADSGPNVDVHAKSDEGPPHEVELDAFFLSKYEMTQGQWQRVAGDNPSIYRPAFFPPELDLDADRFPVENLSCDRATLWLDRLGLSLPTEAQWEYAARGGTSSPWWTGSGKESLDGMCNVLDQSAKDLPLVVARRWTPEPFDDGYVQTAPVGVFGANPFGLHDVIGNVSEWCSDNYIDYRMPTISGDGHRGNTADATSGMRRGGSFVRYASNARVSLRYASLRANTSNDTGLRPARRVEP